MRHGWTLHQLGACCAAANSWVRVSRAIGSGENARMLRRSAHAFSSSGSTAQLAEPEDARRVAIRKMDADAVVADEVHVADAQILGHGLRIENPLAGALRLAVRARALDPQLARR